MHRFHAGSITALAVSSMDHFAATVGSDGTVRCWDYIARRELFMATHDHSATSLCWAPASLDPQCRTVLIGFADGVVRVLYRASTQWLRVQCFKPHNSSITNIAVSPDGKILATGCSEGVVFFVHTQELDLGKSHLPYAPAGFVDIGSPVRSLSWRIDSSMLLAVSKTGCIIKVYCSGQLEPGVSGTYALQIPIKEFNISWPHKTEPLISDEEHMPQSEVSLASEQRQKPHSVSYAIYFKSDTIMTALSELSGTIHVIDEETSCVVESFPVGTNTAKPDAGVVFIRYDVHQSFLITASSDGTVSVRFVDSGNSALHLSCAITQAHDADASVNGAFLSHDASFLLTTGSDGLLVVQRIRSEDLKARPNEFGTAPNKLQNSGSYEFTMTALVPEGEPLPAVDGLNTVLSDVPRDVHDKARESAHSQADDLEDGAYSFEDSRAKSEEDNYRAAAERKKEVVREVLAQMRRDFEDLTRENALQRSENQLQVNDMVLDTDFARMLEDQGEALLEDVRQACQYDSERSKVLIRKLKDRYLNDLEKQGSSTMEGQSMTALLSRHQVGSFRVPQIAGQLRLLLTQLHASLRSEEQAVLPNDRKSKHTATMHGNAIASKSTAGVGSTARVEQKETVSPIKGAIITTLEARKLMRLNRQSKLASLLLQRPAEDTDDPRDIQAIEQARLHLGDYKLKSGEAYEVPHKQQINTLRKRRQMLLLQENINSIKLRYNKRFFALRDVKRLVTHSLVEGTQLLRSLDCTFDSEDGTFQPHVLDLMCNAQFSLISSEWPDFSRNMSKEEIHSFSACQINSTNTDSMSSTKIDRKIQAIVDLPIFSLLEHATSKDSSNLKNEDGRMRNVALSHRRVSVVARMNEHMLAFDNALNELRKEYMPLQADLKGAELRLLILLQVSQFA